MKKQILRAFAALLAITLLAGAMSLCVFATSIEEGYPSVSEEFVFENGETITTAGTYSLFDSGLTPDYIGTNTTGVLYEDALNPAETTYTNGGYDIYVRANRDNYECASSAQLGLSFYVNSNITEKVQLSIYAYDVDESGGETDRIYLVDENTGDSQEVGTLSGMDEEWNNSTFELNPAMFEFGHTYHYQIVGEEDSWCVYVRTVSMSVMATDVKAPEGSNVEKSPVTNLSPSVSISSQGEVVANLRVYSPEYRTFEVEWKATHAVTNNQVASYFGVVDASPEGTMNSFTFWLENGAETGTYRIDAYVKEYGTNNVVQSVTTVAGYITLAVAYNANGGTQNLPLDYTAYYEGDMVEIRFDYIPSMEGYTFLGWATSEYATEPEFDGRQNVRLTMGDSDVTLYAIWCQNSSEETVTETLVEDFVEETETNDWDDGWDDDYYEDNTPNYNYGEWSPSDAYSYSDALYDVLFGCSSSISIGMALPLVGVAGVLMLRKGRKKD